MNSIYLGVLVVLAANQPHEHSFEDLLQYKCDKGNREACQRLQQIRNEKEEADRIQKRVAAFSAELESKQLMLDEKRPDLKAAYPLVMGDYIHAVRDSGSSEELVSLPRLQQCATHYHEHWINKKLWWPNDDGKPDWADIYVFIVDHYYGFCVKQH
ncbi:MAG: hypothetical protein MI673_00565 [Thiotrichales bacterium]|nr:hypothetical protein [Thiotrichales bacterium]